MDKYDSLKIEYQLCFPLYAAAKEVVKKYAPLLEELDLTYTQYITMMVLWEYGEISSKELGNRLFLDSGTLTPLLKKLEDKGYISRGRSENDARNLMVKATEAGMELRERALLVPPRISQCISLEPQEAMELYRLLYKILGASQELQPQDAGKGCL